MHSYFYVFFNKNTSNKTFKNTIFHYFLGQRDAIPYAPELKAIQTNRIKYTILKVNITNAFLFLRIFQQEHIK